MPDNEAEQAKKRPVRPRKAEIAQATAVVARSVQSPQSALGWPKDTVFDGVCPVCHCEDDPVPCLITQSHTDQRGIGFKGLICPGCGIVRIARGKDGRFLYGYQDKWSLQE